MNATMLCELDLLAEPQSSDGLCTGFAVPGPADGLVGYGCLNAATSGSGGSGGGGQNNDEAETSDETATNTASSLGDDFVRALDDIDNGAPRPNVRNPEPFDNDGRGGTTRLPSVDSSGNPISYVEHTVNPRPPGGSLDGSRIATGSDGSVWATTDHFTTWTRIR